MTKHYKQSRFNHFVDLENGDRLAFNALACGLAVMDADARTAMDTLCGDGDGDPGTVPEKTRDALVLGRYIVDAETNELDRLRAGHYMTRFGSGDLLLTVIPTFACNFSCDYCYEPPEAGAEGGRPMTAAVRQQLLDAVEKRAPKKGMLRVFWYGGEPLVALPVIEELTGGFREICRTHSIGYGAGIVTNGYLLDPKRAGALRDLDVAFAQVTLDGPREVHDSRRKLRGGGGTFDVIAGNIDRLPDDERFRVTIRVNVDRRNAGAVDGFFEAVLDRGWHRRTNLDYYFSYTRDDEKRWGSGLQCLLSQEFSEFIVGAYNRALDYGLPVSVFPRATPLFCGAIGDSSMVVEPGGDLQACWATVGNPERRIGRLSNEGIEWTKNRVRWLGWDPFRRKCRDCSILPLCMGGCPYRGIYDVPADGGDSCSWWKHNLDEMLLLARRAHGLGLLRARGVQPVPGGVDGSP